MMTEHEIMKELREIGEIASRVPQHFDPPRHAHPAAMTVHYPYDAAGVTVYVAFNNGEHRPVHGKTIEDALRAARRVAEKAWPMAAVAVAP